MIRCDSAEAALAPKNLHILFEAFFTPSFLLWLRADNQRASCRSKTQIYGTLFSQFERFVCPQVCVYRKLPTKYKRWKTAETRTTELQMSATMQNSVIHLQPKCAICRNVRHLEWEEKTYESEKWNTGAEKCALKAPYSNYYIYLCSAKTFTAPL